jgi:S-adenosylmethionine:tRNA ribosyltransferase-isomerase
MRLSDFDFDLPEELIALRPAEPRDAARMLVVRPGAPLEDQSVGDLTDLLGPGDALVFNDTRVIPARLDGVRLRDASRISVEATLHKRLSPSRWTAFMKPGKRLKTGDRLMFGAVGDTGCELDRLDATLVEKRDGGEVGLEFDLSGPDLDRAIAAHGRMPLPPYIAGRRREDERDFRDYQTIFARNEGSVAAPTAGLHFTPELIERLKGRGVSIHFVTLHVGAGTFLPVKTEELSEHRMHAEWGEVSPATARALNAARAAGGRIVCVGTTALRLIESAADEDGTIRPFAAETSIFITPGYRFRAADVLVTNFHLPCSTLFMLVSAFSGLELMRAAYAHAIERGYRFYSYGDAGLLFRAA